MSIRTTGTALTVLLAGCSGTTGVVNLDTGATLDGAVSADAGPSGDVGSGMAPGAPDATASGDAASPDSAGPVVPVGPVDSGIADGSAGSATLDGGCIGITVTDDGGAATCSFTPADLECATPGDCRAYEMPGCACASVAVIGVNRAAAVGCAAPHCQPPAADSGCFGPQSYQGQDCVVVSSPADIVVDCVNGWCSSQAAPPSH